jgi:hypothetical protein
MWNSETFRWRVVELLPYWLLVGLVLVVDFLWVGEVVPARLGRVSVLQLVDSVPVVDFLRVVVVVPVRLRPVLVLTKVAWN